MTGFRDARNAGRPVAVPGDKLHHLGSPTGPFRPESVLIHKVPFGFKKTEGSLLSSPVAWSGYVYSPIDRVALTM
jgi:hypothetical protein